MVTSAWNPYDASINIDLTNSDLTATNTLDGTWAGVRSNVRVPPNGKWYFEVYCDFSDMRGPFNAFANGWLAGVANSDAPLDNYIGATSDGAAFATDGFDNFFSVMQYRNGVNHSLTQFIFLTGSYLSVAVDTVNMRIWGRICSEESAHTWNNTAEDLSPPGTITMPTRNVGGFDISGISGVLYPAFAGKWLNNAATLNIAGPFQCTVPTDFSPLPLNTEPTWRRPIRLDTKRHAARQHQPYVIPQPRPLPGPGLPMSERVQHRKLDHKHRLTAREARDKTPPRRIIPPPQQATLWVMM